MHPLITKIETEKVRSLQANRPPLPEIRPGDTVRVHLRTADRVQVFEGIVIARRGRGLGETITVRKISYGVGVEKIIPLHAPAVVQIEVIRRGKVRRAKLYYLRERVGKAARVKEKRTM